MTVEVGSRWYAWKRDYVVHSLGQLEGEPAVRLLAEGERRPEPVLTRLSALQKYGYPALDAPADPRGRPNGAPPDRPQPAADDTKEEHMPASSKAARKGPGPKEAQARAQREAKAAKPEGGVAARIAKRGTAESDGTTGQAAKLAEDLLARVRAAGIGDVVEHSKGLYARVMVEKRTVGYIVPGKTKLNVYPQALASDMPADLGFKKVDLGSHHYGSGEVIVPVDREDDLEAAVKALTAAAGLPPRKRGKHAAEAAAA